LAALAAPAVTTANVNMRQGPGTQYAVISTLPAQASVLSGVFVVIAAG
jgi:uncharacterized protein YraI